ncbi:DUF6461 domain-containing protein [Streptomyces crystallinus]|uniref:Lsr2 protein n=1 Tax=Streptomyces crystallinus TaxID=68191 RepID=A0ABN1GJ16_9ACTN
MGDGIQWLVDLDDWMSSVVFARGISPQELAVRMGGAAEWTSEPITDAEVNELGMIGYRPDGDGDGVVRVGACAGWSFALEYGDSTGGDRLTEISCSGVEVINYFPMGARPPATVRYARDGRYVCGFGLNEEHRRWGAEPDLLLAELVAAGVLAPDGYTRCAPEDEHYKITYRRTLAVVEAHFSLSLSPTCLNEAHLPAYAVRGTPRMNTQADPDLDVIRSWAQAQGYTLDRIGPKRVPVDIREAYARATRI